MHDHSSQCRPGKPIPRPVPRCLDCGEHDRHQDTCPQRTDLLDLLDADLAAIAAGGPFTRRMHPVEVAHLEAMVGRVPRRDRRDWTVRVHPCGPEGVTRTIHTGAGRAVAEFIDA